MHSKTLIALCFMSLGSSLMAQEATGPKPGKTVDQMLPNQRAFLNLSQEQRTEFVKAFQEANRYFGEKRIFECIESANKAGKVFPESPEVCNLLGSCYVELRAFDKALVEFEKAAKLSTRNNSIRFNIGEVYFVTKQWQKAHDIFSELLKDLPENDMGLGRLTEFKILLCKLKLGQVNEAKILAEKYDFLDDSPYHYFAKAALAYEQQDLAEAERWLARSARIFQDAAILAPWHDTLVEYGYIKSFYGGEEELAVP